MGQVAAGFGLGTLANSGETEASVAGASSNGFLLDPLHVEIFGFCCKVPASGDDEGKIPASGQAIS